MLFELSNESYEGSQINSSPLGSLALLILISFTHWLFDPFWSPIDLEALIWPVLTATGFLLILMCMSILDNEKDI